MINPVVDVKSRAETMQPKNAVYVQLLLSGCCCVTTGELCDYRRAACCKECIFQSCTSLSSPVCKAVHCKLPLWQRWVLCTHQRPYPWLGVWDCIPKWEFFASIGVNKDGEERRLLLQLKTHDFKREMNTGFQHLLSKNDFKSLGCPFVLSKLSLGIQFQVEK